MSMYEDVSFGRVGVDELTVDGVKQVSDVALVIGAEAANVINVGIQLIDYIGNSIARRAKLSCYLSDDANGDSIVATTPDTVAIGTDGVYIPLIAGKRFDIVTKDTGHADINITKAGADTFYLIVEVNGKLTASLAITTDATT